VQAVLDALGKRHGPEDTRSEGQRFHDALQQGCALQPRVGSAICIARVCAGPVSGLQASGLVLTT
jgi:hypothetical protein